MRRRFFVDSFQDGKTQMDGELAHHLGRVLRAQPGQLYELSDGTSVWLGRIETVSRDTIDFSLMEELDGYIPALETTLLLAVVKFEAFEWAIEKATELGVSRIVPVSAARSDKALLTAATKRAERWKKILFEASQQSRRVKLPLLSAPEKPAHAFASNYGDCRVLLSESPAAEPMHRVLAGRSSQSAVLAVGPEGGWTEGEFAEAKAAGFQEASLGKLILRTETAVIASLAALNYQLGEDE
jgi:16S rRNA (uracil1498-N3)-methyltransferase